MSRPTVLHVVADWGAPGQEFVQDTVRSSATTRPVVAAHHLLDPRAGVRDLSRARVPPTVALAGLIARERVSVVHCHSLDPVVTARRAAGRTGRPFAITVHGSDVLVAADQDEQVLMAMRSAALVLAPSQFLADAALARKVRHSRMRVVPPGVDLAALPFRERGHHEGPPVVTFAGPYGETSGVLDVARALSLLSHPVRARFVGHGPLEQELRSLLGSDAELLDGRTPGAVRTALAQTDLLVTAFRTSDDGDAEALGRVNLEAMACGVPVVTARHGGVAEAVHPSAAELVPAHGNVPRSLADALDRLLADPSRWAAMGRAGRAHVAARYELGARTADLEQFWRQLAAGFRGWELQVPGVLLPPVRASVVVLAGSGQQETMAALSEQTRTPDEVVVARSLNDGITCTTGDVLAFTAAGSRPAPEWLEALLSGFREGVGAVRGQGLANAAYRREDLLDVRGFDETARDPQKALAGRLRRHGVRIRSSATAVVR